MLRFLGGVASLGFLPAARKYFFKPMRESNKQITEKQRQKKAQPVHNAAETGAGVGLIVSAPKAPRVMKKESAENLAKADKERRDYENDRDTSSWPTAGYGRVLDERTDQEWPNVSWDELPDNEIDNWPKYRFLNFPILKTEYWADPGVRAYSSYGVTTTPLNVGRDIVYNKPALFDPDSLLQVRAIKPEDLDTVYHFVDDYGINTGNTYTTKGVTGLLSPTIYNQDDAKRFFYQQLNDPNNRFNYSWFNDDIFGSPDVK